MKTILLLFTIIFSSTFSFAQNSTAAYFVDKVSAMSTGSRIDVNAKGDTILVSEYDTRNVKQNSNQSYERYYLGTPYLNNGWFKGKVILEGGEPVEGLMAFNLVRSSVYYSKNEHTAAIELKPTEFSINGHAFSKYKGELDGAGDYYYETLSLDEPMLLKMYDCKYTPTKSDVDNGYGSSSAKLYEGEYLKKDKFYLVIDKRLVLVTNKKSFLKNIGKYREAATAKVKMDKLNLKRQEDIISLSQYLSTL